jgi:hypothetical protein
MPRTRQMPPDWRRAGAGTGPPGKAGAGAVRASGARDWPGRRRPRQCASARGGRRPGRPRDRLLRSRQPGLARCRHARHPRARSRGRDDRLLRQRRARRRSRCVPSRGREEAQPACARRRPRSAAVTPASEASARPPARARNRDTGTTRQRKARATGAPPPDVPATRRSGDRRTGRRRPGLRGGACDRARAAPEVPPAGGCACRAGRQPRRCRAGPGNAPGLRHAMPAFASARRRRARVPATE